MLRYRRINTDDKGFEQKAQNLSVAEATKTKTSYLTLIRLQHSLNLNYLQALHHPTTHVPYHLSGEEHCRNAWVDVALQK